MKEEKNTVENDAEIIPVTKDNYNKILRITYKSMWQPPFVFIVVGGIFGLPFCSFLFLAKFSFLNSFLMALIIVVLYTWLGPLLYVKLSYRLAKKDPRAGLRKHRHLSKFDEV